MTDDTGKDASRPVDDEAASHGRPVVYVMPDEFIPIQGRDTIDLNRLISALWRGKWLVASVTAAFVVAAVTYVVLATEWYRAEVLLAPAEEKSTQSLANQFGGLASFAGLSVGSTGSVEPVAVLRSREFSREFIQDLNLLSVLFADEWDAAEQRWKSATGAEPPDIRDAVRFFREEILTVVENSQNGLVSVYVEWIDPVVAAQWASLLVKRLNARMREWALLEAEQNVEYLRSELSDTNVLAIHQSIGRLLESELQKLMLARGNQEFSFRVIDSAMPPKDPSRPKGLVIVVLAMIFGGFAGTVMVLVRDAQEATRLRASGNSET